jgi:RHS repeat-associated protein
MKARSYHLIKNGAGADAYVDGYYTGINLNQNKYRYGYQGSEKDADFGEDFYSTYYRGLDTRLGRWFSIDPKPNYSVGYYCSMEANPINLNDPLGDIVKIEGTRREKRQFVRLLNKTTGNKYKIGKDGVLSNSGNSSNIQTTKKKSGELSMIVGQAMMSEETIDIKLVSHSSKVGFDSFDSGELDISDFKKAPRVFQAGMLAHVVQERLSTPKGYSNRASTTDAEFDQAHNAGLESESRIITTMLGKPYALRTEKDTPFINYIDNGDGTKTTNIVGFKTIYAYGSVQFVAITGVVKKPIPDGSGRNYTAPNGDYKSLKMVK